MTVLGTPLTRDAVRMLLLGSGELGKEVAIEAQRLGVEVVAVDRYAHAPAHQVAHRSYVIDMRDPQAVRDVITREQPDFVVPEIEAIATETLMEIENEGLSEVIPTARGAFLTMNREGIRRLAAEELRLPTSRYAFAGSLEELKEAASVTGFPCVVKPVMSSSGKGQSVSTNEAELASAWREAQKKGRVAVERVIVESFIEFQYEITLLTVRASGPGGTIETHFCEPIGHRQERGDYVESWQPQPMSEKALYRAREMAEKITTALGGRGIFGCEFFVNDDQVWFSEVSPRPHDTGLVTLATQYQSEFELHVRAILGLPVSTAMLHPGASAVIYGQRDAAGVRYGALDAALRVPGTKLRLFGKPEAFMRRRMGVALAMAGDIDTARRRAQECAAQVAVLAPRDPS
ncbi:formate-dependent phosphoribosylglycinamide formyltransferase [Acidiferrobacter sp.]|uniref:formate-dependent phosphoribosylglycinamide formyltransferase n=1 Tax=Acidiferrobacter sp. TaxID=1872107 RepID=UPI00262399BD|nr:formate-dependent phosphoribosylglycinamide formyltransferase [Acidiferrobacter sp.]